MSRRCLNSTLQVHLILLKLLTLKHSR